MKGKIRNNLILKWVIFSVSFALIVHILFSWQAPHNWLIAKWSAGELLTYVSTIALGLLAVWQNKVFQEENEKSQLRLEELTQQANELNVVSKVIEIQKDNLDQLYLAVDGFSEACSPAVIEGVFLKVAEPRGSESQLDIISKIRDVEDKVDVSLFALSRQLRQDVMFKNNDDCPLKKCLTNYYLFIKSIFDDFSKEVIKKGFFNPFEENRSLHDELIKKSDEFLSRSEEYLKQQEDKLNNVLYGNLSLEQIKELYGVMPQQ